MQTKKTLRLLDIIIDAVPEGLPLGYYTSQWLANFYLQDLDHYIKQEIWKPEKEKKTAQYIARTKRKGKTAGKVPKYACGVKYGVRYVDDIVCFGANKRDLKVALERIEAFCEEKLGLIIKDTKQIFPLSKEYEVETIDRHGKKKIVTREIGRALDFMGFLFRRTRTTIRKAILYRITRKARKISKKQKINWLDASSMISRMGYFKHTNSYNVFACWISPFINIKQLKKKVSKHGKKGSANYAAA